jgi:hypothetical protein
MGLLDIHTHNGQAVISPCPSGSSLSTLITDDRQWTEGDVELVSSDGVRFRVPFYVLAHR